MRNLCDYRTSFPFYGWQRYPAHCTCPPDTQAERTPVSNAVRGKCDALDGASDGMVQDVGACQAVFDLQCDVPTCTATRFNARSPLPELPQSKSA
jgi:hypothetical protein